ncbi:MAG: hypothetical protein HFI05_02125 [Lachnospiraceae bacterium]|jgi:2-hydroxy-3-keto-5-methylthiopentenyl-1-phosphate phosphatase|nr:hypothetical protein [Lachnospiraceae bacterium]
MLGGKEVYRSVKLSDNINPVSLSIVDQVRLMFAKLSNDDVAELDINEKLTINRIQKIAALDTFINKALRRMQDMGKNSVVISLSSEFLPYIDEVIDPIYGQGRFYEFEIIKRNIPINVKHSFIVKIKKKWS